MCPSVATTKQTASALSSSSSDLRRGQNDAASTRLASTFLKNFKTLQTDTRGDQQTADTSGSTHCQAAATTALTPEACSKTKWGASRLFPPCSSQYTTEPHYKAVCGTEWEDRLSPRNEWFDVQTAPASPSLLLPAPNITPTQITARQQEEQRRQAGGLPTRPGK